jgi:hypothetical protein
LFYGAKVYCFIEYQKFFLRFFFAQGIEKLKDKKEKAPQVETRGEKKCKKPYL